MKLSENEKPLIDKSCLLEKFPGKGGWTYAALPEILPDKNAPFGWRTVRGSIDRFVFEKYKLMPMGNGRLFLPVRAAIRKAIGKQAGDSVRIILFADSPSSELSRELAECFDLEVPALRQIFEALPELQKNQFLDKIHCAGSEDEKADRIAEMMADLANRTAKL